MYAIDALLDLAVSQWALAEQKEQGESTNTAAVACRRTPYSQH